MMGKSHIIVNSGILLSVVSIGSFFMYSYCDIGDSIMKDFCFSVVSYLYHNQVGPFWFFTGVLLISYFFGTLLPDVDSKASILGRVMYLPIEHRTWTHTIWPLCFFGLCSIESSLLFCMSVGYFFHLLEDSFSYQGVCWFYPFSKYRVYASGAKVKQKHACKLYRSGKISEGVCVSICFIIAIVNVILFGFVFGGMLHIRL